MKTLIRDTPFTLPIKFIQFGEGNFLRAFIDWQIDLLNERCGLNAGVVVVRPVGNSDKPSLDTQGGVYTTVIRGLNEAGEAIKQFRKITCVQREINCNTMFAEYLQLAHNPDVRFIVSNTTEAGIAINDRDSYHDQPPTSFPAKLTRLLHERFCHFSGAQDKGVVLLPCELIDHNGQVLAAAVRHFASLWQLGDDFSRWLNEACFFCSTLVDRIVPGYPHEEITALEAELGYHDQFLVAAEYFHLFVIEGPAWLAEELKLAGAGLNIKLVDDITPYKQRKVGVLNGGHTAMVPVALLATLEAVGEAVDDPVVGRFLQETLDQEIIPSLPLERTELDAFAADVLRRFRNPYIHHRLESIALNSWSKFAARVMPQLLTYQRTNNCIPPRLAIAFAATVLLYRGGVVPLVDDPANLAWFKSAWRQVGYGSWSQRDVVQGWLANTELWGRDLNCIPGLTEALTASVDAIDRDGIRKVLAAL